MVNMTLHEAVGDWDSTNGRIENIHSYQVASFVLIKPQVIAKEIGDSVIGPSWKFQNDLMNSFYGDYRLYLKPVRVVLILKIVILSDF